MPYFCSLPWTPFRECWKSAAMSVLDLILVEVYGKCQFVVDMLNLSFFFKRFLFPLSFRNLNVSCHGGRPWIAALCFSCMFAGEISGSLFVSGQHCSHSCRDQRRFPNSSRADVQTGAVPSFEPIVYYCFTYQLWRVKMCLSWNCAFTLFAFEALWLYLGSI